MRPVEVITRHRRVKCPVRGGSGGSRGRGHEGRTGGAMSKRTLGACRGKTKSALDPGGPDQLEIALGDAPEGDRGDAEAQGGAEIDHRSGQLLATLATGEMAVHLMAMPPEVAAGQRGQQHRDRCAAFVDGVELHVLGDERLAHGLFGSMQQTADSFRILTEDLDELAGERVLDAHVPQHRLEPVGQRAERIDHRIGLGWVGNAPGKRRCALVSPDVGGLNGPVG